MASAPASDIIKRMIQVFTRDSLRDTFRRLYYNGTIRPGTLVGTDQFGNKYYQAPPTGAWARSRWFEPSVDKKQNLNAAGIPPEWHMWITRIDKNPPTSLPLLTPRYQLQYKGSDLSKMAQEANYVPSGYYIPPKDVNRVVYPPKRYTNWSGKRATTE